MGHPERWEFLRPKIGGWINPWKEEVGIGGATLKHGRGRPQQKRRKRASSYGVGNTRRL